MGKEVENGCDYFKSNHSECTECNSNSIRIAEENKRKFKVINKTNKEICQIQIDDCVFSQGEKKCDWLFLVCEDEVVFFVELKGQDLIQALRQIGQALDNLLSNLTGYTINARIVLSKVNAPDLQKTELIKFKKRIKKLGGTLDYKSRQMEEIIK